MKVRLDRDKCQGHGRCYVLAPGVFGADDDGYGYVIDEDVPAGMEEAARKGAGNCPEDAITITDGDNPDNNGNSNSNSNSNKDTPA